MNKDFNLFDKFVQTELSQTEKLTLLRVLLLSNAQDCAVQRQQMLSSLSAWMLSLEEVPDEEVEHYCELGEFVSRSIRDENAQTTFKTLLAQFLLEQNRMDEAVPVMEELLKLMPDNDDLLAMSKKCGIKSISVGKSAEPKCADKNLGCDDEFYSLVNQLKTSSIDQLLSNAATWVNRWVEEDYEYYGLLLKTYRGWYGVGVFGQDRGFVNYFGGLYQYWKQNVEELVWLYQELADYRSKMTLKTMIQHWMTFHPDLRRMGRECQFEHYFDFDVIKCDENEVFVDCGCFDGNTVKDFIRCYGTQYKHIYSYELTPSTYEVAKENLKEIPRLSLRNTGVSDENGQFPFRDNGFSSGLAGANRLNPGGNSIAHVVRIDDDIKEDVTFIKMDIEGAECAALRGAENQIRRNKPKLAISLYHKTSDLLEIPRLIKSFVPEYKLYLRQFVEKGNEEFPFPIEYVLLAVSAEA